MSTSVIQGFQACLKPQIVEPHILHLDFASPNSSFPYSSSSNNKPMIDNNNNGKLGGWDFIQSLINTSQNQQKNNFDNEKLYIHPLVKCSASTLSQQSLEMCTENLGSETGSDISENLDNNADFVPTPISTNLGTSTVATRKTYPRRRSFPPPLSSISGSVDCVRVKPHREGGRLVIKVVTVASSKSFFRAERGNGCLRLYLLKEDRLESIVEAGHETEEKCCHGEDMNGNIDIVEGKMGKEDFQKYSRCKDDGHMSNGL